MKKSSVVHSSSAPITQLEISQWLWEPVELVCVLYFLFECSHTACQEHRGVINTGTGRGISCKSECAVTYFAIMLTEQLL